MHSIEISDYSAKGDARGITRLFAFAWLWFALSLPDSLSVIASVGRLRILQVRCESIAPANSLSDDEPSTEFNGT